MGDKLKSHKKMMQSDCQLSLTFEIEITEVQTCVTATTQIFFASN
jgi:hypothetical protein